MDRVIPSSGSPVGDSLMSLVGSSTVILTRGYPIDGMVPGVYFLYRPLGSNYVVDRIRVGLMANSRIVTYPWITVGYKEPLFDEILGRTSLESLRNIGSYMNIFVNQCYVSDVESHEVYVRVETPAVGVQYDFVVQLIGMYL